MQRADRRLVAAFAPTGLTFAPFGWDSSQKSVVAKPRSGQRGQSLMGPIHVSVGNERGDIGHRLPQNIVNRFSLGAQQGVELTPLIRKLRNIAPLDDDDVSQLALLCCNLKTIAARTDIISEGDRPEYVHLIVQGWAARYRIVDSGARQLTAFLIPGDFCDLHVGILARMDHAIEAVTPCRVAYLSSEGLDRLTEERGRLTRALWWATLLDEAILREWIVNNGRRDARAAMAHLLCEMRFRLQMTGANQDGPVSFPVSQEDLANATGMTPVHANRTLQGLRKLGLIELKEKTLTLLDPRGLVAIAGFRPDYFHLRKRYGGGVDRPGEVVGPAPLDRTIPSPLGPLY